MSGSWWFKMGLILAAFVGSIYVLTPTVLDVLRAEEARELLQTFFRSKRNSVP